MGAGGELGTIRSGDSADWRRIAIGREGARARRDCQRSCPRDDGARDRVGTEGRLRGDRGDRQRQAVAGHLWPRKKARCATHRARRTGTVARAVDSPGGRVGGGIGSCETARARHPTASRKRWAMTRFKALAFATALGTVYQLGLRRRFLNWGATQSEADAHLPGDELLAQADGVSTRAVTINTPRGAVWPWIAQMGPAPRGGAYTYDWLENILGLDMHTSDVVLADFQHPQIGDTISLGANRMRIERVEPEHVLAWRSEDGHRVWTF